MAHSADHAPPVVMVVDDEDASRALITRELTARYATDYLVLAKSSPSEALKLLRQIAAAGRDVALILADRRMSDLSGEQFLATAHEIHPRARRALLVTTGQERASRDAVVQACALGQADYYLVKPMNSPDERFHRGVTEFLDEWWRLRGRPAELIRIVGEERSARCHEIRDLLHRHELPYGFYASHTAAGQALLANAGVPPDRLPIVLMQDGRALINPTNREVAEALGVAIRPTDATYDVTIVGDGPAGLAAAVYAASEGLRTVLIEREALGGQAGTSSMIRNYLGFPRGISGSELAARAVDQAVMFGTEIVYGSTAIALRAEADRRVVSLSDGSEVASRAVVIASGVSYRRLDIPELEALIGVGVFYGASMSEAQALAGQRVFVVGGGNSAGQAAVHLAKYAQRVTILVRSGSLAESMSQYLINDIDATPNIDVRCGVEVVGGGGEGRLQRLELKDRHTQDVDTVPAAAVFVLIGAEPFTDWLPPAVLRDQWGYVLTGARCGVATCDMAACGMQTTATAPNHQQDRAPLLLETSLPGVFAVGDVRQGSIKRVASGAGEGSICIRLIHEYLALPVPQPTSTTAD